jgi:hypothetical protein
MNDWGVRMGTSQSRSIHFIVVLALTACGSSSSGGDDPSGASETETGGSTTHTEETGTTGEVLDPNAPKFYDDVLPILTLQCNDCHSEGGIGPMRLDDYDTARIYGEVLRLVTEHRSMPPFNASNTGECNTFRDARWMTDEELETIAAWVDGGRQEGDPNAPQPERPEPDELAGDDIDVLLTPEGYVPVPDAALDSGLDDYRCFLADPGIVDAPRYLLGYEVVPGTPAVTHHLVAFKVDPARVVFGGTTNGEIMAQLESTDDRAGWDCYGQAGQGVLVDSTPITWAPGGGAFNFPEGTGIRFDPGEVLVLQMHYNLANGDDAEQTAVRLSWADEVEREAVNALYDAFLVAGLSGNPIPIPAGDPAFTYTWDRRISSFHAEIGGWEKVELLGMLPHMHEIGRRMHVQILRGADEPACGLYVDRWDFNWQQAFMYEEPIVVSPTDQLQITCEWDASQRASATYAGLGTGDEMCLLGIFAARAE